MTPLSSPIPLRSSTAWGGYREAKPIPHRYGYCSGGLLQYDETRRVFVWADHAVESIDEIAVNGQTVGEWEFRNTTDSTGHAIATVVFGQPQDEGVSLTARGRGKKHPVDGRRMENPADVVWDALANIAGRDVTTAALSDFRRQCEREGLEVGGSIDSTDSTQTIIRAMMESVGGIYCADMPGVCRVWPGASAGVSKETIALGPIKSDVSLSELANDLTIQYGWEDGSPRGSVRLDAPDSVARYGRRPATIEAKWVTSSRVAVAVAQRILAQRARPVWTVEFAPKKRIAVGDSVTIAHPLSPVSGVHVILSRVLNLDTAAHTATIRAPVGDSPVVRIVQQSSAFEPAQYAGLNVETIGGERILTLREEGAAPGEFGPPIVGAAVTLDGTITRYTDAGGRVSFPVALMPPGEHLLVIVTADTPPRTLTSTVLIA